MMAGHDPIKKEVNLDTIANECKVHRITTETYLPDRKLKDDLTNLRNAVSRHIDSILCLCSEGREFDSPGALLDKVESETKRLLDEIIKGRF